MTSPAADFSLNVDAHLSAGGHELQPSEVYSSTTGMTCALEDAAHCKVCALASADMPNKSRLAAALIAAPTAVFAPAVAPTLVDVAVAADFN